MMEVSQPILRPISLSSLYDSYYGQILKNKQVEDRPNEVSVSVSVPTSRNDGVNQTKLRPSFGVMKSERMGMRWNMMGCVSQCLAVQITAIMWETRVGEIPP